MTAGPAPRAPVAEAGAPQCVPLYRRADFRAVAGDALRPGGLALTARGLDAAGFSPGDRVADVGCGPGVSLELLRRRGIRAFGFEAAPDLAAEASARVPEGVVAARAEALPLPDGCLDGVVFECVLSALPGMPEALVEVRRVLVPGGRLLVTDLYRRDGAAGEPCADGSCAAGARTREAFLDELFRAGLVPVLFEDHSRFLAELTGKLLFAGFSAADVGTALTGRTPGCACGLEALRPRLGYFLCVAVKEVS